MDKSDHLIPFWGRVAVFAGAARHMRLGGIGFLLVLVLIVLRRVSPERSFDYTGPLALYDAAFALSLLLCIVLLAGGIGLKILSRLNLQGITSIERVVFGAALGLGILGYGVLALGLLGWLQPRAVLFWLLSLGLWSWREWSKILQVLPGWFSRQYIHLRKISFSKKLFLVAAGFIFALTVIQALTPPWDYDGLVYHLEGPRKFLAAGRILPLPDIWGANGPFTIEMLFTLGLSFESDTFAKLIHLTYALLLMLATFAFGQRYLKPSGGWVAAGIMLGIPIFPLWASLAYADMAWASYEFLAVYALLVWSERKQAAWLILSGIAIGFGLASKFMALMGFGVLGLWILFLSWKQGKQGLSLLLYRAAMFGCVVSLVASPWYLKNWLWLGNPVYPLYFGGLEWPAERVSELMAYLYSFGAGHSFKDQLLLPWNLYVQHQKFATFMGTIELPSLIFPLVLLYPWVRKSRIMNNLSGITALWFALWALGSQQIRFLLPIFPGLSLLTSSVIIGLADRLSLRKWGFVLTAGLTGGVVISTLIYAVIFFLKTQPLGVVIGLESKDAFLRRTVFDYSALQYIQAYLTPEEKVLMMWDGQGYYCDDRCLPDTEHNRWTRLALSNPNASILATKLRAAGITHLLFSLEDLKFQTQHDPMGRQHEAATFFWEVFQKQCTQEVYRDRWVYLFAITCS